jgi:hypothetical protein
LSVAGTSPALAGSSARTALRPAGIVISEISDQLQQLVATTDVGRITLRRFLREICSAQTYSGFTTTKLRAKLPITKFPIAETANFSGILKIIKRFAKDVTTEKQRSSMALLDTTQKAFAKKRVQKHSFQQLSAGVWWVGGGDFWNSPT